MRLFIAFQMTEEMKQALVSVQDALRRGGARGNYTRVENLHLTLAFIGEYPDPDRALEAMGTVSFAPIPLGLEGFGSFGDLYWCGLRGSDALSACAKRLRRALAEAGVPYDRSRFRPRSDRMRLIASAVMDASGTTIPGTPRSKTAFRRSVMWGLNRVLS